MNDHIDIRRPRSMKLFRDGTITSVVLLLIWAAVDDITTDHATTFRVEYSLLFASAAWLALVAVRLLRAGWHMVGGLSVFAIVMAVWAQRVIRPGVEPGLWLESVVIIAAYLWFWCVSGLLLCLGWRSHRASQYKNV